MRCVIALALVAILFTGCSRDAGKDTEGPTLIEDLTGSANIERYKSTRVKLEDIDREARDRIKQTE
jgi:hypothetical protein